MTVTGRFRDELDLDQDGISACEGDCDDSNAAINPGQSDICNGLDDDCDGDVDEDGVASCDDGLYCNGAETCGGGSCLSGTPIECGDSGDACQVSQCDDSIDACVNVPTVDGTVCDDGNLCTVNDSCQAGTCASGSLRDCSGASDSCNDGV